MTVSTDQQIKQSLDSVTSNPKSGVPGLVFASIDKNGEMLTQQASGRLGLDSDEPMTLDTVFWIASCTKMIAGIACMQLVEQGKLDLDDSQSLYKLCPELKEKKVIVDAGNGKKGKEGLKLVEKEKDITLRMLLDHTAGFGYTFFNEKLRDWGRPIGYDEFTGDEKDILEMPLVNQPGSRWEYGINIDWAGIAVMRASGLSLNDYFQKNIFEPLGLKNINMYPTSEMKKSVAYMQQTDASGSTMTRDHLYRRPLKAETDAEKKAIFNSGGAGCFARPVEYCQILATLLNDGTSPTTKAAILKPETVQKMFTNSIPQFPNFSRQGIPAAKPEQTNPAPELYPQPKNPPQGWGLTFFMTIEEGPTGRGKNTGHWAGLANLFWWCDREKGVAGMIASQVLPFGNLDVMTQWGQCEALVYQGLGK